MSAWTPGPWVACNDSETIPRGRSEVATVACIGEWIVGASTPGFPGGNYRDIDHGTEEADATLIAAAPELVEALLAIITADDKHALRQEDIEAGRAALKKAGAL
jgi:hypothetical protein